MASFVGHSLVALSIGALCWKSPLCQARPLSVWLGVLVAASLLPDLDVLLGQWVPYSHPLGHRGLSHSLFFALLISLGLTCLCRRAGLIPDRLATLTLTWLSIAAVLGSHGLLDALTNGGLGVALFGPFTWQRYFFPWRPIPVSYLSPSQMFSPPMRQVFLAELTLFGPLCLAAWLAAADLSGNRRLSALRWLAVPALVFASVAAWLLRLQAR